MKYSINIDHELRLIRYTHSGLIYVEDIGEAWKDFLSLQEFTDLKYNLLSDFRGGKFQIADTFVTEITNYMQRIETIVKSKKQALITDDPYSVAISMIFADDVYKKVEFNVKVFTTETAALRWLCA